jgi:hypothetical protein
MAANLPAAAAPPVTARVFAGAAGQVREARRFLAGVLDGCPAADDALLCASDSLNLSVCSLGPFCCFSGRGSRGFRGRLWRLGGG